MSDLSLLRNARHTNLYNSVLTSARTINHMYTQYVSDRQDPVQILVKRVISGALHDALRRYDVPKCHPQTRVALLESMERWSRGDNLQKPIVWLCGAAGAGKSAIAQTLCERLARNRLLAASFFFSRTSAGRNESSFLVATLAYQLGLSFPLSKRYLEQAIAEDPLIFERSIITQVTELIINPLTIPSTSDPPNVKIVVIDGLDECSADSEGRSHEEQQRELLEAIGLIVQSDVPLRFVITSRPERQVRESFRKHTISLVTSRIVLDNSHNPNADIDLYLRCKFGEVRDGNPFLQGSWPSEDIMLRLILNSSGHFVYASTVIRYVGRPRSNPEENLKIILNLTPEDQSQKAFSELDALYLHILRTVQPSSLSTVLDILGLLWHPSLLQFGVPFPGIAPYSPEFMARMLFTTTAQIYTHLIDLHSILDIPPIEHAKSIPIRLIHASFSEFLTQRNRSEAFYVDAAQVHLRCQLNLMLHVITAASFHPSVVSGYNHNVIRSMFLSGLRQGPFNEPCPRLPRLKQGVEALQSRSEEKYFSYLRSIGMESLGTYRSFRLKFPGSTAEEQENLRVALEYLQRCNMADMEPSVIRRSLVAIKLESQIKTLRFLKWARENPELFLAKVIALGSAIAILLFTLVALYLTWKRCPPDCFPCDFRKRMCIPVDPRPSLLRPAYTDPAYIIYSMDGITY